MCKHWFFNSLRFVCIVIIVMVFLAVKSEAGEKDFCVECHTSLDGKAKEPADKIGEDVHFKRGLSCSDCHGGDPSKEDFTEAKDPSKGFIGKPKRNDIPQFCGRCHSDPVYMRRFNPNSTTDQLAKYNESQHGKLNAQGDQKVAVCISCHDVHGIREVNDPSSPVFITNMPARCSSCHSDKGYMKDYPIPTDQMEKFEKSVHGEALLVRGDRGAPACNSCHSSHGAALPGAVAVGNVCAQCHSLTRDLFAKSPHKKAHDSLGIPECEACHGNHGIMRTSDDMLGTGPGGLCLTCHAEDSKAYAAAASMKDAIAALKKEIKESEDIVTHAENAGMDVSDTEFYLDEAKNALTKSRTYIHSFSKEKVGEITKTGAALAEKVKDRGRKAIAEFKSRRTWLAVMVGILLLVAAALYFKVRTMEKS